MELNDLTSQTLDKAAQAIGSGPVTMVNLVRFRPQVIYPTAFTPAKPDPRSAYYEGYAGAFRSVAQELGVEGIEVVFAGSVAAGLVAAPEDRWDEIVVVRYATFTAFRRIVESDSYLRLADPHRRAAVTDWRLFVTITPE